MEHEIEIDDRVVIEAIEVMRRRRGGDLRLLSYKEGRSWRSVLPDLTDPQVKSLADRIGDEQEPEIAAMSSWLSGRGQDVPPESTNPNLTDHGSHAMPGMATAAELARLATASGADADRLG